MPEPSAGAPVADDVRIALDLLLESLAAQERTSRAIYRLLRDLTGRDVRRGQKPPREAGAGRPLPVPPSARTAAAPTIPPAPTETIRPTVARHGLEIRVLGRFEVLRDGVAVERWRRAKSRVLLKYLVAHRQPIPRDALLELLWPDSAPEDALNGLRVVLHALRTDLRPANASVGKEVSFVVGDGNVFQLSPTAPIWVDAEAFVSHVELGRLRERQLQTAEAVREYEAAEALYRDDYLIEDTYEDWTHVRREELKDLYLMVLTKLADHCLRGGDPEGCIVRCHRILAKDVCREDAYRRLMRSYAQLGQRSRAIQWHDTCVRTLRQEFNVGPSAQTQALYQQIAAGGGG